MQNNQDDNFTPKQQVSLEEISAKLDQPHKFAKIFCEAAESQKSIDEAIKKNIRELIKSDQETRDLIIAYQKQVNAQDIWHYTKKLGFVLNSIFMLIVGAIITVIAHKYY